MKARRLLLLALLTAAGLLYGPALAFLLGLI